ncbi:MAG: LamG domain-containing protein, partial [Treponema sp.]|nr:LamG domain-containing protein [Treponema sp.]
MGRGFETVNRAVVLLIIHFRPFFADIVSELMKKNIYFIALLYLFFAVSGSLYSIGEKTIQLDGSSIWKMADYRAGITEMKLVRPNPVLALSSSRNSAPFYGLDLALSFDEGNPKHFRDSAGNYRVSASPSLEVADNHYARIGSGAALFSNAQTGSVLTSSALPNKTPINAPLMVEVKNKDALFAPNNRICDFSIEFWLYPLNMENGEQILQWTSARAISKTNYAPQRILCVSSKNRLQWSFTHFFNSPDAAVSKDITINGVSPVVPKTWSHHLIHFDSVTGMVEYLVNGKAESIEYATSNGHEYGEVYTPIAGEGGCFILGSDFSGMIDEFRIYGARASGPNPMIRKYPLNGGRIETRAIDLGDGSNGILKLEACGGRTSMANVKINNEYRKNGRFRFSDDSEMQFFIRCSDNPYRWDESWQAVTPGAELNET